MPLSIKDPQIAADRDRPPVITFDGKFVTDEASGDVRFDALVNRECVTCSISEETLHAIPGTPRGVNAGELFRHYRSKIRSVAAGLLHAGRARDGQLDITPQDVEEHGRTFKG